MENSSNHRLTKEALVTLSDQAKVIIDIKDRKLRFKTYKSCFVGRELCKWFIMNKVSTFLR